jgi:glycosyltransferase involved in cell wall biosynthesis
MRRRGIGGSGNLAKGSTGSPPSAGTAVRVVMAAPRDVPGPIPTIAPVLASALRASGFVVELAPWGGGGSGLGGRLQRRLREFRLVRGAVRDTRPDVLLVQTSHDWPALVRDFALVAAVRGRVPRIVLEFHGSRAELLARRRRAFPAATRLLLRSVDAILVLSREEQAAFASFYPERRCEVVVNPFVPWEAAAGTEREALDFVVLFASRLLKSKGLIETVEAFSRLRTTVAAKLVVAGHGPAEKEARQLVTQKGLSADVEFAGHVRRDELGRMYASADVFVLPTYSEGFPTVLSEAMSAGLPLVTTPIRGSRDLLVEGVNALFVPPRDASALTEALLMLAHDPELRRTMGEANRAKIEEFAPGRVVGAYARVLAGGAKR